MGNTVLGNGTLCTTDRNKDTWLYWLINILVYIKISMHDFKAIKVDMVTNNWLRKASSLGHLPQGIFMPKNITIWGC